MAWGGLPRPVPALGGALLLGLASGALAAPLRDAATGLAVDPPPSHAATAMPPSAGQASRFVIRRAEEQDDGCQVAFVPAPQNAALTQAQINALLRSPGWQAITRRQIGTRYDILEGQVFEQAGIAGFQLVADLRPHADLPERARMLRSFFSIQETPRGRTTTVCVAEKAAFPARRAEFLAVVRGISPPR